MSVKNSMQRGTIIIGVWLPMMMATLLLAGPGQAEESKKASILDALRPKKLILSIGINEFSDPIWPDLRYAAKDAEDIYNQFMVRQEDRFDGGVLLTSVPDSPVRMVTRKSVFQALQRLETANRHENDVVIVYVSAHGTVADRPDGGLGRYIVMSDTDSQNLHKTAIAYEDLLAGFRKLRSRRKVLILAFCHSGSGKSRLTPAMRLAKSRLKGPQFREPIFERSEGEIILSASAWAEPALEDAALKNDVYTHFLLQGFRIDGNQDGAVTITEAHTFAARATYTYTKGRQRPSARLDLLGADPVIVSGKVKKERAWLYSVYQKFTDLRVTVDGKDYGLLNKGIQIPGGRVRLALHRSGTGELVDERVVHFKEGLEYAVSGLLMPTTPHSLQAGAVQMGFISKTHRRSFAPDPVPGIALTYRLDEAISVYDLGLGVQWYPWQEERVEVGDNLLFRQRRRMASLAATLGLRNTIRSLSRSDQSLRSEVGLHIGPGLVALERVLAEPAADEHSGRRLITGGMVARAAFDLTSARQLLRLSAGVEGGLWRSFFPGDDPFARTLALHLQLGTFW